MCANCLGNVDMIGGTAVAAATAIRGASVRLRFGAADRRARRIERDRRVIAFLRDLDLDPVAALGAPAVDAATAAVPVAVDGSQIVAAEPVTARVIRSKATPAIL